MSDGKKKIKIDFEVITVNITKRQKLMLDSLVSMKRIPNISFFVRRAINYYHSKIINKFDTLEILEDLKKDMEIEKELSKNLKIEKKQRKKYQKNISLIEDKEKIIDTELMKYNDEKPVFQFNKDTIFLDGKERKIISIDEYNKNRRFKNQAQYL